MAESRFTVKKPRRSKILLICIPNQILVQILSQEA